jgi:hypothetical protein
VRWVKNSPPITGSSSMWREVSSLAVATRPTSQGQPSQSRIASFSRFTDSTSLDSTTNALLMVFSA